MRRGAVIGSLKMDFRRISSKIFKAPRISGHGFNWYPLVLASSMNKSLQPFAFGIEHSIFTCVFPSQTNHNVRSRLDSDQFDHWAALTLPTMGTLHIISTYLA